MSPKLYVSIWSSFPNKNNEAEQKNAALWFSLLCTLGVWEHKAMFFSKDNKKEQTVKKTCGTFPITGPLDEVSW